MKTNTQKLVASLAVIAIGATILHFYLKAKKEKAGTASKPLVVNTDLTDKAFKATTVKLAPNI